MMLEFAYESNTFNDHGETKARGSLSMKLEGANSRDMYFHLKKATESVLKDKGISHPPIGFVDDIGGGNPRLSFSMIKPEQEQRAIGGAMNTLQNAIRDAESDIMSQYHEAQRGEGPRL